MRQRRAALLRLFSVTALSLVTSRHAAADEAPADTLTDTTLSFDAHAMFGEGTVDSGGDELFVRIRNSGSATKEGTIEISPANWMETDTIARARYAVPAGGEVVVHLPVLTPQPINVVARDVEKRHRMLGAFAASGAAFIRVIDVEEISKLSLAMGTVALDPDYRSQNSYSTSTAAPVLLQILPCHVTRETGEAVLPQFVSGWRGVQLAIMKSDRIAHLESAELAALSSFVLGGGTLALTVTHARDLGDPTISAFLGGAAQKIPASPVTLGELRVAEPPGTPPRWTVFPQNPADTTEVASYAGGNLEPSLFGATASYGLGEVVLLGFDPTRPVGASDPWAQVRVADLARRAYERQAIMVFGPGSPPARNYSYGYEDALREVRMKLDPNQGTRSAIGVATIVLCIYAVLAGPLSFWMARKRKKPLRAFLALPVLSGVVFFLVVAIGFFSRGSSSRARRLTFVDVGAGMSQGVGKRFRGFFSSHSATLTVSAYDRTSVFVNDLGAGLSDVESGATSEIDHDGARQSGLSAIPWQTVLVQEQGLASLGEGISVTPSEPGSADVIVKNRTGKPLRSVVIRLETGRALYVSEIADGARVDSRDLSESPSLKAWTMRIVSSARKAGRTDLHGLDGGELMRALPTSDSDLGSLWMAAESTVTSNVDWFPSGIPVVLAVIDSHDGGVDTGMKVDSDRTLLRVVGLGGEP